MKFYWCTVHTACLDDSVRFYERVLGLAPVRRIRPEAGREIVFLTDGTVQIELISADRPAAASGLSLGFATREFERTLRNVLDAGIEIVLGPVKLGDGLECFFITDPNGIGVQIMRDSTEKRRKPRKKPTVPTH